jgi:hypothetical protein
MSIVLYHNALRMEAVQVDWYWLDYLILCWIKAKYVQPGYILLEE